MTASTHQRVLIVALVVIQVAVVALVLGLADGLWSSDAGEPAALAPVSEEHAQRSEPGSADTPAGSLMLITATPTPAGTRVIPAASPTSGPAPAATPTPGRTESAGPVADFSGRWRIVDVVTEGASTGQRFSFDVVLEQNGTEIRGGNSGIQMSGVVSGETAVVEYVQPALGYRGTFIWTMNASDLATGSFTNTYPNAGRSTLQRLQ